VLCLYPRGIIAENAAIVKHVGGGEKSDDEDETHPSRLRQQEDFVSLDVS